MRATFVDLLSGEGRDHVDVTVPHTDIHGRMRLLSRAERSKLLRDLMKWAAANGLPPTPADASRAGLGGEWNIELAARVLAVAVRTPDETEQLGSVDDWRDATDDQIDAIWEEYQDLRQRLDPFGEHSTLTEEEARALEAAAKKGDVSTLTSYGSRRLALFAISSAARPAS